MKVSYNQSIVIKSKNVDKINGRHITSGISAGSVYHFACMAVEALARIVALGITVGRRPNGGCIEPPLRKAPDVG